MSRIKSLILLSCFFLCAVSSGAQTAVSDTLNLKIVFEGREVGFNQKEKVIHVDDFVTYLREFLDKLENPAPVADAEVHKEHKVFTAPYDLGDPSLRKPVFAVRTNALAIPFFNAGVEVPINRNWSVGADCYYPWFSRKTDKGRCSQLLAFDIEGRYWFAGDRLPQESRLLGHSLGAYIGAGYYDYERDWSGHQGEFINLGLDYLYAMPLWGGAVHLEFELGFGYVYSKAVPYRYIGGKYYLERNVRKNIHWFGPTRAQVSVVIPVYMSKDKWNRFCSNLRNIFRKRQ